ncbi:MAG: HPr family phosphocarrier protein [Candidatus Omnitrophica bacterium]|nr:HPr family phosphocarrier protein [Candidatus Omnitrophota bacterium]
MAPRRKRPSTELPTIERQFTITNKLGLHARPAALFVQTANRFEASLEVRKEDVVADGKSIMGIMTLAAEMGSTILVRATGRDAEAAVQALEKLLGSNFGE